jgi:hypothetical protein
MHDIGHAKAIRVKQSSAWPYLRRRECFVRDVVGNQLIDARDLKAG